jgi:hypothetical protein
MSEELGYFSKGDTMKRILLPLAAVLLIAMSVPAFAGPRGEWELGIGWTPSQDLVNQSIISFHIAYAWSILYFSWDAYAMPDYWVYNATTYVDPYSNQTVYGTYLPGFLNLFDVGVRFVLKPVLLYAEVGPNLLYIYGGQIYNGGVGVNARFGVGFKFDWWGVNLSYTQVFSSWSDLEGAFGSAFHGDLAPLGDGAVPTINFAIYF